MLARAFLDRPVTHRALHGVGRPENSRAAIEAAIEAGYGIEIDVQLSSDGQAMVFHDYVLDRLTAERGPIARRSAAELSGIHLTGVAEGIPTLGEVLELVGGRVPLVIELKDQHGDMGETDGTLERATAEALQGYDGPIAVMSFNPHMMAHMATLSPDVPRGLVTCAFLAEQWPTLSAATREHLRDMPDLDRVGASFISHQHRTLDSVPVAAAKAKGVSVLCWTIRTAQEAATALEIADNITFEGFAA